MCGAILLSPPRVLTKRSKYTRLVSVQPETWTRECHNGVGFSVINQLGTDCVRPSSEAALPQHITNDGDRSGARPILFGKEAASSRELNAQSGKQLGRDMAAVNIFGRPGLIHRTSDAT